MDEVLRQALEPVRRDLQSAGTSPVWMLAERRRSGTSMAKIEPVYAETADASLIH
jgi:hypothetical protein